MAIKSFKSLNKYFYSHAVKMVHSHRTFLTLRTLLFHLEKLREYDAFLKKIQKLLTSFYFFQIFIGNGTIYFFAYSFLFIPYHI